MTVYIAKDQRKKKWGQSLWENDPPVPVQR